MRNAQSADVLELAERALEPGARERLRALVARDERACDAFWREYEPLVRGLLRRMLSSREPDRIEEGIQDVFVALFEGFARVREPSALRGFVVGTTMNWARGEERARRRRARRVSLATGSLPEVPVSSRAAERVAFERLAALTARLSVERRAPFVLRALEQMEIAEIAEALSLSESTVKRRVRAARALITKWASSDPWLSAYLAEPRGDSP